MKTLMSVALAGIASLQLSNPARADPPIWANAKWVKASFTNCGGVHYLTLRGKSAQAPKSNDPACATSEEIYHQLNVSKSFFANDGKGAVSAWNVDAGYYDCGKGEAMLILGAPGQTERARRQLGSIEGCKYSKRRFQYVSSLGSIPFIDVANGGTMSVAESLAMHAKEREQIIANCNADPACRAQVNRMRSSGSSGSTSDPCIANGNYSRYNGAGRCTDGNGNPDPRGNLVSPQ